MGLRNELNCTCLGLINVELFRCKKWVRIIRVGNITYGCCVGSYFLLNMGLHAEVSPVRIYKY